MSFFQHTCQMWREAWKRGIANTGGRAAPWLSHGAASLQWLGEVKAPDNISIVAPAALLGCRCFSGRYVCRIFRVKQILLYREHPAYNSLGVGSTRTSGPATAGLCPFGAMFVCAPSPSSWCCCPLFSISSSFVQPVNPSFNKTVPQSLKFQWRTPKKRWPTHSATWTKMP